jgi:hypothetical protein
MNKKTSTAAYHMFTNGWHYLFSCIMQYQNLISNLVRLTIGLTQTLTRENLHLMKSSVNFSLAKKIFSFTVNYVKKLRMLISHL